MSLSNEELISFFRDQVALEDNIVRSVKETLGRVKNVIVKDILSGIAYDSMKHADIYRGAIEIASTPSTALTEENLGMFRKDVERHIENEMRVIDRISKVVGSIENQRIVFLLKAILEDERRHHELLRKILEIIVRAETITDDEWWEVMWRDVPTHGSPGG